MNHNHEVNFGGVWRFRLDPENLGEHFPEQLDTPWQFDARWMDMDYVILSDMLN